MLLLQPLYKAGYVMGMETMYMLTFPLTALFFLIFALPSFIFLKDHGENKKRFAFLQLVKIGFQKVRSTLRSLKKYKNIAWFILGFCILNDALVTILSFVPIYAKTTLHFTMSQIMFIIILVQVIGFPAAILFGWLSDKIGSKKVLLRSVFGWILITCCLALGS
jgi:MFS transporter, UMF1 family